MYINHEQNRIIKITLLYFLIFTELNAHDEEINFHPSSAQEAIRNMTVWTEAENNNIVDGVKCMCEDAKVTGELRSMYSTSDYKNADNISALAVGGVLKYELFPYYGLNAAIAVRTSKDGIHKSDELSSSTGDYTAVSEAYINYSFHNLEFRFGRQILNTPLADGDDKRMVPNTFEAYIAAYKLDDFSFMLGHFNRWQGFSAGLDEGWVSTGEQGTNFLGTSFDGASTGMNFWFYNINDRENSTIANNSFYIDFKKHFHLYPHIQLDVGTQYLRQEEQTKSGISSQIYGFETGLNIDALGIYIAYNKALKKANKQSFSGFGGGTLFTNMDSMILDVITEDREAKSWVTGLTYKRNNFDFLYAYGQFIGAVNGNGTKEFITEHNIALKYVYNQHSSLAIVYAKEYDRENTLSNGGTWDNIRILLSYLF